MLAVVASMALSTVAMAQSHETYNPAETPNNTYVPGAPLQVLGSPSLLDTRPGLVTLPGAGAGGADVSRLQNASLGMTTLGGNVSFSASFRMAEDFVVTGSGWTVNDITVYAYQTNSPTTSSLTGLYLQIWDGDPSLATSNVIFGDTTTNVMTSTAFSNIFRDSEGTPDVTNRPIMAATAAGLNINLPAGTYWLDWSVAGSLASGPWAPPLTTVGQATTGNAMQFASGVWGPFNDSGSATQQGLPMTIGGTVGGVPLEPARELPVNSNWLLLALLGGLLGLGALAMNRR